MAASVVSTVADSPVVKAAMAVGSGGQLVGGILENLIKMISDIYCTYMACMGVCICILYMHVNVHSVIICAHCMRIC